MSCHKMSCSPSSSTSCSQGSLRKSNDFPLSESNKDTNQELVGQKDMIPISQKFKLCNPQRKGFTVSTISDVYHRCGAEIITCFSIFDANFEDFNEGCVLTFPNMVREKVCEKDITSIMNVRRHGVISGTYHEGGIPHAYEHRSQTIYRMFDKIRKIVKENTNWGEKWGLSEDMLFFDDDYSDDEYDDSEENDSEDEDKEDVRPNRRYVISDYNNIPVLFYTDDFIDLEEGKISFSCVPINFIIGKYFIAIPLYINATFQGYAVAQQTLWCMACDQAGVAIFTTWPSWNTSPLKNKSCKEIEADKMFDPDGHPPYLLGNYSMERKFECLQCEKYCLSHQGYFCALESTKYFCRR